MDHDQLNVLVIDDDPAVQKLLSEIIIRAEHQVVTVQNAEEGLKLLPFWTFQVAFIDQNLPGMEGLVFGEYLRGNNPDMTIALITGDASRKLQRKSRDLEILFIEKPFQITAITKLLDDYVVAAQERRENRLNKNDPDFAPRFGPYADDIGSCFDMPNVPQRVSDRLIETLKRSLNDLRSVGRYTERDRLIALCGLITAKTLGLDLPRISPERTMFEEYDVLMKQHGRRPEFSEQTS
jgi:CheY-like chemotaxis protein